MLALLGDWQQRAAAGSEAHYGLATRYARLNVRFGVPVVALTTFVGTSVFATLEHKINIALRVAVGIVSVLAAILASLQTFLRFGERSERHRAAAEKWAALRREIDEMRALHPTYLASRGDPKQYLDDLRRRMDEIAQQSPELGEHGWLRSGRRYSHQRPPEGEQRSEPPVAVAGDAHLSEQPQP